MLKYLIFKYLSILYMPFSVTHIFRKNKVIILFVKTIALRKATLMNPKILLIEKCYMKVTGQNF